MPDESPETLGRMIVHLERCLAILEEAAAPSPDIAFLHTFLLHAKGYLAKDVSADTEALENWDTPENQAMIQRFITHVAQRIRLMVEEWRQTRPDEAHTSLREKLHEMVAGLDRIDDLPDVSECGPLGPQCNGSG